MYSGDMVSVVLTITAAIVYLVLPRWHRAPIIVLLSLAVVGTWFGDGLGAMVGSTTLIVGGVVSLFAARQFEGEVRGRYLPALMMSVVASAVGLALSRSPLTLLASWLATSVVTALTLFVSVPKGQRRSVARQLSAPAVADLIFAAVVLSLSISSSTHWGSLTPTQRWVLWIAVALASAARSGATWRSSWVTTTVKAPTAVSALLHAGVVNAGAVLIIRFAQLSKVPLGALALLAFVAAMVMWSLAPRIQLRADLKGQLAVSTVSQMAFMLFMVALNWPVLALSHMVGHAVYKAYRFVNASAVIQSRSTRRIFQPRGRSLTMTARLACAVAIGLLSFVLVLLIHNRDVRTALGIFGLAGVALWWRRSAQPQSHPWTVVMSCELVAVGYPIVVALVARVIGPLPITGVAAAWWVPLVVLLGAVTANVISRTVTDRPTAIRTEEFHLVNA